MFPLKLFFLPISIESSIVVFQASIKTSLKVLTFKIYVVNL